MRNLISVKQLNKKEIENILDEAAKMEKSLKSRKKLNLLFGKVVACLFFEPSTRTRLSFEAAVLRLGGQVISMENGGVSSSVFKGESIEDTIRIVQSYADVLIMRHPQNGAAEQAVKVAKVPFINAGDGGNQHPTQGLLDLYTIKKRLGRLDNLSLAMGFDPKHSRTIKSLCELLSMYKNNEIIFICPKELDQPKNILLDLKKRGLKISVKRNLEEVLDVDILYLNRLQNERFSSQKEFEKLRHKYCLTAKMIKNKKALVMDPLPRIDEITQDVDELPNAIYFEQAQNGLYIRMALLSMLG